MANSQPRSRAAQSPIVLSLLTLLFILFTLLHLLWALQAKIPHFEGVASLFAVPLPEADPLQAWGLTYAGLPGLGLLAAQIAAVLLACALATRATPRHRRLGAALIGLWAGLWMWNFLWLFAAASSAILELPGAAASYFLGALLAVAALFWALHRMWRPGRPKRA